MKRGEFMFRPQYIFDKIWDIEYGFLKEKGINAVFLDVDNTLTTHDNPDCDERAVQWISKMRENGLKLIILSNNTPERVSPFAEKIGTDFITGTKPDKKIYLDAMQRVGEKAENCAGIGDQLFTDVWGANRAGVVSILTKPIYKDTVPFIKFKRLLEKPFLKRYERGEKR